MNSPVSRPAETTPHAFQPDIRRTLPLIACAVSVGLCLAYAKFRADLPTWWASHGGGIPYVLFWILLWFAAFPKRKWIFTICLLCVGFTCLLEVAQLWNPEPVASFRKTRFGTALLGSTFVWSDFPPYLIGGVVGYLVLQIMVRFGHATNLSETVR